MNFEKQNKNNNYYPLKREGGREGEREGGREGGRERERVNFQIEKKSSPSLTL